MIARFTESSLQFLYSLQGCVNHDANFTQDSVTKGQPLRFGLITCSVFFASSDKFVGNDSIMTTDRSVSNHTQLHVIWNSNICKISTWVTETSKGQTSTKRVRGSETVLEREIVCRGAFPSSAGRSSQQANEDSRSLRKQLKCHIMRIVRDLFPLRVKD